MASVPRRTGRSARLRWLSPSWAVSRPIDRPESPGYGPGRRAKQRADAAAARKQKRAAERARVEAAHKKERERAAAQVSATRCRERAKSDRASPGPVGAPSHAERTCAPSTRHKRQSALPAVVGGAFIMPWGGSRYLGTPRVEQAWIPRGSGLGGVLTGVGGALLGNLISRRTVRDSTIAAIAASSRNIVTQVTANSADIKAQIEASSGDIRTQIAASVATVRAQIEADRSNRIWENK